MAKTSGIRVNLLAKELNVESSLILKKLRDEGLGDVATNHMSVLKLGLAMSVREWFAHDGGGTAVEIAPPVEVAVAKRTTRKKKLSGASDEPSHLQQPGANGSNGTADGGSEDDSAAGSSAPRVESDEEASRAPADAADSAVKAPPAIVASTAEAAASESFAPEAAPSPVAIPAHVPAEPLAPAASAVAPAAPASKQVIAHGASHVAPGQIAPGQIAPAHTTTGHGAPGHAGQALPGHERGVVRQAVTLESRLAAGRGLDPAKPVARAPIAPVPYVPKKAEIKGPNVIREEKPDLVPTPRRRVIGDGPPGSRPGQSTFIQTTGRGVKVTEEDEEEKKKAAAKKGAGSLSSRRRGADGRRGAADEKLKEFTNADLLEREERLRAAASFRTGFDAHLKQSERRGTGTIRPSAAERGAAIVVEEPITVKSLSAALGIKSNDLIKKLMLQGVFASINQSLDRDTASALSLEFGIAIEFEEQATLDELLAYEFADREAAADPSELKPRPPVVTILGHVDHGKTSLLDKIRSANVAAGEAGGITQHTAAWMVSVGEGDAKKRVTFIDTPGHQAFTSMRARGANMTDVVVLVVAAVEGVMPQTIESINHAKAAGVPIIVALNKIDRADANPDMVLGQLAQQGLNPVEWGGDTEVVRTSATTGQGIPELIELLDFQSQLLDLKANPTNPSRGTVIEARVDLGLGPIATVLVQDGTLRPGDVILSGAGYGRIRSLFDDNGKALQEAGPSTPVVVSGFDVLPGAGDKYYMVDDLDRARSISEERSTRTRIDSLAASNRITNAGNLLETIAAGDVQTINLIIKGDVQGSVETLVKTVGGQNTSEVKVRVIHSGVGAVTESDVQLAMATKTKPTDNRVAIIGFNVVPDDTARALAEQNHVDVKTYRVIYEIFDDLKKALSGMLSKEVREKIHGHAEIRQLFKVSRLGNIAGCMCTDGHIVRTDRVRITRDGKLIVEGLTIDTLRRVKDDVKEVKSGFECGIKVQGYDDIKIGDRIEAYITEEFERTL